MVEFEPPIPPHEGYAVDPGRIRYDLYRLLASIYASERFPHSDLGSPNPSPLAVLATEFESDEVTRLLLSLAIAVRATINRRRLTKASTTFQDLASGTLHDTKGSTPLTVREACNCIIHADRIRADVDLDDEGMIVRQNPVFYLYAAAGAWKARLDLELFAAAIMEL